MWKVLVNVESINCGTKEGEAGGTGTEKSTAGS